MIKPRYEPTFTAGNLLTIVFGLLPVLIYSVVWGSRVSSAVAVERATRRQQFGEPRIEISDRSNQERHDIKSVQEDIAENNAVSASELADIKAILTNLQTRIDNRWETPPDSGRR